MRDEACTDFLQWSLPRLGLRWRGYRKVRHLVAKRLGRRLAALGLADLAAYRAFLGEEPGEWARLEELCRIPISRFYRDQGVFDAIGGRLLPELAAAAIAQGRDRVRCWSAGCASGEEPYTLAMVWRFRVAERWPALTLDVIATDADEGMIARAKAGCYGRGSLKALPTGWRERAFAASGTSFRLEDALRERVRFARQDIRQTMPPGCFDLVLCRNLVFTYFDEDWQRRILAQLREHVLPAGFLVLGSHERLPADGGFAPYAEHSAFYRRETLS